jgi:tRNA 2-selenouridine synthase SelU
MENSATFVPLPLSNGSGKRARAVIELDEAIRSERIGEEYQAAHEPAEETEQRTPKDSRWHCPNPKH